MTSPATDPASRRKDIIRAVMAHRRDGTPVEFVADDTRIGYDDRLLELTVSETERGRLLALLSEFPVFKVKQPETRKAPDDTVYVSAIADPKHLADFLEACFQQVYDCAESYALETT